MSVNQFKMRDSALHLIHWHPSQDKKYRDMERDEVTVTDPTVSSQEAAPALSPLSHYHGLLPNSASPEHEENRFSETDQVNKPRLTNYQHAALESHFSRQLKPTTKTKQVLANRLGLSLPRVQNWFQNRRAKEKQIRRQREMSLSLSLESAGFNLAQPRPPRPAPANRPTFTLVEYVPPGVQKPPRSSAVSNQQSSAPVIMPHPAASYSSPQEAAEASLARFAQSSQIDLGTNQFNQYPDFNQLTPYPWNLSIPHDQSSQLWPTTSESIVQQSLPTLNDPLYNEPTTMSSSDWLSPHPSHASSFTTSPAVKEELTSFRTSQMSNEIEDPNTSWLIDTPAKRACSSPLATTNQLAGGPVRSGTSSSTIAARRKQPHLAALCPTMRSQSCISKPPSPATSFFRNAAGAPGVRRSLSANAFNMTNGGTHRQQVPSPLYHTTFADADAYISDPSAGQVASQLTSPGAIHDQVPLTPLSSDDQHRAVFPVQHTHFVSGNSSYRSSSLASTPAKSIALPLSNYQHFASPPITPDVHSFHSPLDVSGYTSETSGPYDESSLSSVQPVPGLDMFSPDSPGHLTLKDDDTAHGFDYPAPDATIRASRRSSRMLNALAQDDSLGTSQSFLSMSDSVPSLASGVSTEQGSLCFGEADSSSDAFAGASLQTSMPPPAITHAASGTLAPMENAFFSLEPHNFCFDTTAHHRTDFLSPSNI